MSNIEFERIRTGRVRSFVRKGKRVKGFRRRRKFKDQGTDLALEEKARKLSAKSANFRARAEAIEFVSRSLRGFDSSNFTKSNKKKDKLDIDINIDRASRIAGSSVSGSRAAKNIAQAVEIGQRIQQKRAPKTGIKDLDRALAVGLKVAKIAGTAATASKSASLAAKNVAGIFQSGRKLRVEEKQTAIKKVQVNDEIARTALWEKSLQQSDRKKNLLEQQLKIKQEELKQRKKKNDEKEKSERIKVRSFKRRDGTVVKASSRRRSKRKKRGRKK